MSNDIFDKINQSASGINNKIVGKIEIVKVEKLKNYENNIYDIIEIDELKESIKLHGLNVPLEVDKSTYEVISGNRRLTALSELGIEEVPVIFKEYDTKLAKNIAMINANEHRTSINPTTRAKEVAILTESYMELGLSKTKIDKKVAARLNLSDRTIRRYQQLDKVGEELKSEVNEGNITLTDAIKKEIVPIDPAITEIQDNLIEKFGNKVVVKKKSINISFSDIDDLNTILDKLGVLI